MGPPDPSLVDNLVDRLAATPRRLRAALGAAAPVELERRAAPDAWSAREVLVHLRASDDIVAPRLLMVLTRDGVPLAALDERRWADVAGYERYDVLAMLETLERRRSELVAALRLAPPEAWLRAGVHEVRGPMSLL